MIRSFSPQQPDRLVFQAPPATAEHIQQAADRSTQDAWWRAGPAHRADVLGQAGASLRARQDEAVDLVVAEVGKPLVEARGEVARAIAILNFYAQACYAPMGNTLPSNGLLFTERRPRGIAALITPWNFPLAIPLWKAAPALAAGNGVLLKPSPEAIGCAALLADIMRDTPFTALYGGPDVGRAVIDLADVVSFTGSTAVGRRVVAAAAARGMPVQAEMGGHNAAIVLPDADPQATAAVLAAAAMGYAGQKCTATSRIIIVADPAPITDALVAAVNGLAVGDPADPAVVCGPVINTPGRVVEAASGAGRQLTGHRRLGGNYVAPILLDQVDPAHPVAQNEIFGPLAVILTAKDTDDAVMIASSVPHGLVTSIHGADIDSLLAVARRLDTGLIRINAPTTGVDFHAPFGGEKASSYGPREQGLSALDFYSSTRTITVAGAW